MVKFISVLANNLSLEGEKKWKKETKRFIIKTQISFHEEDDADDDIMKLSIDQDIRDRWTSKKDEENVQKTVILWTCFG